MNEEMLVMMLVTMLWLLVGSLLMMRCHDEMRADDCWVVGHRELTSPRRFSHIHVARAFIERLHHLIEQS